MKRSIAAVLYWLAAVTIALGAYGHGFLGVKGVEGPIAASTLPHDVVGVIWIVWYFVSGSMLIFGILLFWVWPSFKTGSDSRSFVALTIGAYYLLTGITSYLYSGREPFWLLFLAQGVIVIGSTMVLRQTPGEGMRAERPNTRR